MKIPAILAFCDQCMFDRRVKVPAVHSGLVVLFGVEAELDLCESCALSLTGPLFRLLDAVGHRASRPGRASSDPARPRSASGNGKWRCSTDKLMVVCGHCGNRVRARKRTEHAGYHGMDPWGITWDFGPDVTELWWCSCGMPFPSLHGRGGHVRSTGHAPGPDQPSIARPRP